MMAITAINLYAVRLLLRALGQEDYGTFNAVAGVVLFSAFITVPLAMSIQRFYSYTLGEKRTDRLSMIFSASMNIILVLSVGLFFIFETIGLWFVNNELSIPSERLFAANCVFQSSLITLWFGLLQQPFTAAIFAQEEMGAFALISLTECMLRLGVIFFIGISDMDGLIFYSIGLSAVAMIIFLLYAFIVRRRYPEYKYCRKIPKETYHSLLALQHTFSKSIPSGCAGGDSPFLPEREALSGDLRDHRVPSEPDGGGCRGYLARALYRSGVYSHGG